MQQIKAKKVSALFIKAKAIEKSKEVLHMIFLGLSSRYIWHHAH